VTPSEAADWIVVAAPVLGAAVNLVFQIGLVRLRGEWLLGSSLMVAFVGGALVTLAGMAAVWLSELPSLLDGIGLTITALAVYASAGFILFALVNLGETSLRVQMIDRLLQNPDGLRPAELLALQSDDALIEVRISRMKEAGQVRVVGERLYPRLSTLFLAAAGISLLKRLLFGHQAGRTPLN